MVVVSDHNTILGIKKLKTAIKLVSELSQNKCKEYIEVINGVEISCADRVHVLIAFPDNKFKTMQDWLDYNLVSVNEGSFKSSLEILDTLIFISIILLPNSLQTSLVSKKYSLRS
ncbi:hypothetical protein [Streptococcus parasuis]|uniref:hypothetical protein n=1 Tax=Streptococcus parasuis TaxID=1501662 RepID=UPI00208BE59F|nr:hypothetical protein [Streptococcus suis]WNF87416.1 hypothetical protein RJW51_04720 [Streptococcus parasuis]GIC31867.1 hypothetical protein SUT328_17690 [Streptococcus parasuis]